MRCCMGGVNGSDGRLHLGIPWDFTVIGFRDQPPITTLFNKTVVSPTMNPPNCGFQELGAPLLLDVRSAPHTCVVLPPLKHCRAPRARSHNRARSRTARVLQQGGPNSGLRIRRSEASNDCGAFSRGLKREPQGRRSGAKRSRLVGVHLAPGGCWSPSHVLEPTNSANPSGQIHNALLHGGADS